MRSGCGCRFAVWLSCWLLPATAALADEPRLFLTSSAVLRSLLLTPRAPAEEQTLDLAPLVRQATAILSGYGIPLREDRELAGPDGIALAATFVLSDELPPLHMRVGDRAPLGAFYADEGFRWALSFSPQALPQLALHLEGGEHSEFGHAAIGGVQWRSPDRAIAVGLGVPLLQDSDEAAVLWQIRVRFD